MNFRVFFCNKMQQVYLFGYTYAHLKKSQKLKLPLIFEDVEGSLSRWGKNPTETNPYLSAYPGVSCVPPLLVHSLVRSLEFQEIKSLI